MDKLSSEGLFFYVQNFIRNFFTVLKYLSNFARRVMNLKYRSYAYEVCGKELQRFC